MTLPSGHLHDRLLASSRSQLLVTASLLFASFAGQVGITRRYGVSGLGEYVATSLIVFLASVAATSAIPLAVGERIAHAHERLDERGAMLLASSGFVLTLALSGLAAALVAMLWTPATQVLRIVEPPPVALAVVAVLGAGLLGYVPAIHQARLQMAAVGVMAITQPLVVVLALAWDTVFPGVRPGTIAMFGYIGGGLSSLTMYALGGFGLSLSRAGVKALVRQALRSLPILYVNIVSPWADRLVLSLLLGPIGLGTYQAAYSLVDGALRVPRSASPFLVNAYARLAVGGAANVREGVALHFRLWLGYAAVLSVGLFVTADVIALGLFGPGSGAVATPLRVLSVALVPAVASLSLATATIGSGAARVALRVSFVSIPVQIGLMLALASIFGVVGGAIAYLAGALLAFVLFARWSVDHQVLDARVAVRAVVIASGTVIACDALGAIASAGGSPWPATAAVAAIASVGLSGFVQLELRERRVLRRLLGLDGV